MKKTIITLCLLIGIFATLPVFSQTPEAPAPKLPLITELTNKDGKTIEGVQVIAKDDNGVTIIFRGRESYVKYETLSEKSVNYLKTLGDNPQGKEALDKEKLGAYFDNKREKEEQENLEAVKLAHEINDLKLTPLELKEMFLEGDEKLKKVLARDIKMSKIHAPLGRFDAYTTAFPTLITKIPCTDEDEVVSLKEDYIALGVKPQAQVGASCAFSAFYHLFAHDAKKSGYKNIPSKTQIKQAHNQAGHPVLKDGSPFYQYLPLSVEKLVGNRPMMQSLFTEITNLNDEYIKYFIRKGKPVVCQISYTRAHTFAHVVVVIGFETKNKKTTFEYIDSNLDLTENGSGFAKEGKYGKIERALYTIQF